MENYERNLNSPAQEEDSDVRKGPWTEEEDAILVNFVSIHGDARWNHIALSSGIKLVTNLIYTRGRPCVSRVYS
ncbi:hypothetical protein Bca52824_029458 [Brassica carinata]|uniref:Uncharacterized protein n=1 Tax=Brassica carinata TaxID=52824 RepID=A0A8X7VE11_BRACI|nr:hypothetical protein Bca52824_029458 [Brassica carinata]